VVWEGRGRKGMNSRGREENSSGVGIGGFMIVRF
jgi:hypothetical protein